MRDSTLARGVRLLKQLNGARMGTGLLLALVFVLAFEATTRAEEFLRYGVPFFSRVLGPDDLIIVDEQGPMGRPGAVLRKWRMNAHGFRGAELRSDPADSVFRVAVVGASETFGLYESPDKEYPAQLADSLRAVWPTTVCPPMAVEVVNAALPGMALPTLTEFLSVRVAPLRPDVILIYPTPGFYLNPAQPRPTAPVAHPDTALPVARMFRLRSLDRIRTQLKGHTPGFVLRMLRERRIREVQQRFGDGWVFDTLPPDRLAAFDHDLRAALGAARATHAMVGMLVPAARSQDPAFDDPDLLIAWQHQFPRAAPSVLVEFHNEAAVVSRTVARDSLALLIDVPAALAGAWRSSFADFVHFTDAGAARVAGVVSRMLTRHALAPMCTADKAMAP